MIIIAKKKKSIKIKNKIIGKGDNKVVMKNIRRYSEKKRNGKYVYTWDTYFKTGNPIKNDNAEAKNVSGAIKEVKKRLSGKSKHGYMKF